MLRDDSSVEMSRDFRFEYDATTYRVRARMACACPDPNKGLRKLEVGDGSTASAARHGQQPVVKVKTA